MKDQNRNYRMFKKRIAEMDIYQEYRRSHERVKVMLNEEVDNPLETPKKVSSPQDNLRNFIKKHEAENQIPKLENRELEQETEQEFIRFNEDTITQPYSTQNQQNISNFSSQESYHYSPPSDNLNLNSQEQQNFNVEPNYYRTQDTNNYNNDINESPPQGDSNRRLSKKSIEDELENIIREALYTENFSYPTKDQDVDPELLNLMKEFLVKNNPDQSFNDTTTNYYSNQQFNDQTYTDFRQTSNPQMPGNYQQNIENQPQSKTHQSTNSQVTNFEKQIQNQQAPPKPPTAKRPSTSRPFKPVETTFSSIDYDDSSLALTKKEIKAQVKNLINETITDHDPETPKPDGLLQLEKQLKEHLEKIKQSRKE